MAGTDKNEKSEKRPDAEKLKAAAKQARSLAQDCYSDDVTGPCWNMRVASPRSNVERCFEREMKRLKGEPTLPEGATMRSYSMFNPEKLCGSCLAYWHIEMGAQALHRLRVMEEELAAYGEGVEWGAQEHRITRTETIGGI